MKENLWVLKKISCNSYFLSANNKNFECQIGSNGLISQQAKQEGDLCTPKGKWLLNSIFYRQDRIDLSSLASNCYIKMKKITKNCGWCDDPLSFKYNKHIRFDQDTRFGYEKLWREDNAYDIVIEINYNQNPTIKDKGSAIFIHCSFKNYRDTKGCVAVLKENLFFLVSNIKNVTYIVI